MDRPLVARASATIDAPVARVWDALVDPEAIRRYMFGTTVVSDWTEDSPIVWKGEWKGKAYEDTGVILRFERGRVLRYSHFSPLSGLPDTPENHHTLTIELVEQAGRTRVSLAQDNNPTEQARHHSERNWSAMLGAALLAEDVPRASQHPSVSRRRDGPGRE
jgi:uncharacterized protein YndB with AHSA1/START domain